MPHKLSSVEHHVLQVGDNDVKTRGNHDISSRIFFHLGHLCIEKYWINNHQEPLNPLKIGKRCIFPNMT